MMPSMHPWQFSLKKITWFLLGLDGIFILLHLMLTQVPSMGHLFNLNQEANIPTWYASFKLSLAAIAALLCYQLEKKQSLQIPLLPAWLWIMVALLMLFMSLDETAQLHETLSGTLMDSLAGARLRYAFNIQASGAILLWGVLFAPLLILIAGSLLSFYYHRFHQKKKLVSMAFITIFLLLCAFVLEQNQAEIAGQMTTIALEGLEKYQLMSLIEEICELVAISFLVLIHLAYAKSQLDR